MSDTVRTDAATALAEVEKVTTALLPVPTGEVVALEAAAPDQAEAVLIRERLSAGPGSPSPVALGV